MAKGQVYSFLKLPAESSEGWSAKDQATAPGGRSVWKTLLEVGGQPAPTSVARNFFEELIFVY